MSWIIAPKERMMEEVLINELDQDFIKTLIDSMPKRVAKVVQVNGNAIEY